MDDILCTDVVKGVAKTVPALAPAAVVFRVEVLRVEVEVDADTAGVASVVAVAVIEAVLVFVCVVLLVAGLFKSFGCVCVVLVV